MLPLHPYNFSNHKKDSIDQAEQSTLQKLMYLIKEESDVDFSMYKPNTIIRRLERRVSISKVKNLEEYYDLVRNDFAELQLLY